MRKQHLKVGGWPERTRSSSGAFEVHLGGLGVGGHSGLPLFSAFSRARRRGINKIWMCFASFFQEGGLMCVTAWAEEIASVALGKARVEMNSYLALSSIISLLVHCFRLDINVFWGVFEAKAKLEHLAVSSSLL